MSTSGRLFSFRLLLVLLVRTLNLNLFIDDGHHSDRLVFRSPDLDKGMLVLLPLFTGLAVVEIIADAALVPSTDNRVHTTAIALDVLVLDDG